MKHAGAKIVGIIISVVITGYNRKDYIKFAVESVAHQTLNKENYEVLVITNFEDEGISSILSDSGTNYRIITMGEESIGYYYARALDEAKGEIISFLDDDDEFFPDKLEYVANKFLSNVDLVYLSNNIEIIDETGERKEILERDFRFNTRRKSEFYFRKNNIKECYKALRELGNFCNSNISIRKKILDGDLDDLRKIVTAEDDFLFFRALFHGGTMLISEKKLTKYRIHRRNISTGFALEFYERLRLMNKEVTRSIDSLSTMLSVHTQNVDGEMLRCLEAQLLYFQILKFFSSTGNNRIKMSKVLVKYVKLSPWRLSSSHFRALVISIIYLVNPQLSKLMYRYFGLISNSRSFAQ